MSSIRDIIPRKYGNFKGVDFSNDVTSLNRSPYCVNMYKNYDNSDCIETRGGFDLITALGEPVYKLIFYKPNTTSDLQVLFVKNNKLFKWENYPTTGTYTELYSSMNPSRNINYFIYDSVLFIHDGINYLEYNGVELKEVVGTIPLYTYWKKPNGQTLTDDGDLIYQDINVLTPLRTERFIGDGESTNYYLTTQDLDSAVEYVITGTINGNDIVEGIDFSVNRPSGIITFNTAPANDAEVCITCSKTIQNYSERVLRSEIVCEFDNRMFFSGNPNYPNAIFHSEINDPRYIRDTAYYECGVNLAPIKALIPGANNLVAVKDSLHNTASIHFLTPTIDSTYGVVYPVTSASVSLGCDSTGINFNDDIVYLTKQGLVGLTGNTYGEQVIERRSSLVDLKMINEQGYKDIKLIEYKGYLLCYVPVYETGTVVPTKTHIYLADSRQMYQDTDNSYQYEWYYWEIPEYIQDISVYNNELYACTNSGNILKLEDAIIIDNGATITSIFRTSRDNAGTDSYIKTTNKKGGNIDFIVKGNDDIKLTPIVNGIKNMDKQITLSDSKGYSVFKLKVKKYKDLQFELESTNPFSIVDLSYETFVSGYLKK